MAAACTAQNGNVGLEKTALNHSLSRPRAQDIDAQNVDHNRLRADGIPIRKHHRVLEQVIRRWHGYSLRFQGARDARRSPNLELLAMTKPRS
jgi:hypothetical protein